MSDAQTVRPAITTYGERNASAPPQLAAFSFLVGKWEGKATPKLADGTSAEAVNFEPSALVGVRIRHFDGASTWKYLD